MTIDEELKSKFPNSVARAHVNVIFTANQLSYETTKLLKPYGLSVQQYNILRILRGQNGKPAPLKLLSSRMIDKMSNTSRLVDKLVNKGYVDRTINPSNRRQVNINITDKGLDVLDKTTRMIESQQQSRNSLTEDELDKLSKLLDKMRGGK